MKDQALFGVNNRFGIQNDGSRCILINALGSLPLNELECTMILWQGSYSHSFSNLVLKSPSNFITSSGHWLFMFFKSPSINVPALILTLFTIL